MVSLVWPPMRSAATPVRMPLRAAYTAAAEPAGPPPTISTSNGAFSLSLAASRAVECVSSLATTSSIVMRPEPNTLPPWNTIGTAITWRASTSGWKAPPSITVVLMRGLRMASRLRACTTSGQLWQLSDMYTSKLKSWSRDLICSMTSASTLGGCPPIHSKASTSDVNSCPNGKPAKRKRASVSPARCRLNDGRRLSLPSKRRLILSLRNA